MSLVTCQFSGHNFPHILITFRKVCKLSRLPRIRTAVRDLSTHGLPALACLTEVARRTTAILDTRQHGKNPPAATTIYSLFNAFAN